MKKYEGLFLLLWKKGMSIEFLLKIEKNGEIDEYAYVRKLL